MGFGMFGDGNGKEMMMESKAEVLGTTVEELEAQLEDKTFPQLLDEQGITHQELQEQMHTRMQTNMAEKLQQMVDEGTITEEQMQEKLDFMAECQAQCEQTGECGRQGKGYGGKGMHKNFVDENGNGVCDFLDIQDN